MIPLFENFPYMTFCFLTNGLILDDRYLGFSNKQAQLLWILFSYLFFNWVLKDKEKVNFLWIYSLCSFIRLLRLWGFIEVFAYGLKRLYKINIMMKWTLILLVGNSQHLSDSGHRTYAVVEYASYKNVQHEKGNTSKCSRIYKVYYM